MPKQASPGAASGEKKYGVKSASAELRTNEMQDIGDVVGRIAAAAAGYELKCSLRIELGGEKPAPEPVVEAVNGILANVSPKLKLE